jgi:hypothetical protein
MKGVQRREFIALFGGAVAAFPFGTHAQQPVALTKAQLDAVNTYNNAVNEFQIILRQRRDQISSNQLPSIQGQALYLARINVMSTYKDLTDALPSKIGRPNKF